MHTLTQLLGSYEELIFAVAFICPFALLWLPFEQIDGNPVPTVIFTGKPSLFHAFILCINFAFCGSVITIFLRHLHPKVATLSRLVSVLSMVMALAVVAWLALPTVCLATSSLLPAGGLLSLQF